MADNVREFKATKPKGEYPQGTEGLMHDKDGNTHRDDTWLHANAGIELNSNHPHYRGKKGDNSTAVED